MRLVIVVLSTAIFLGCSSPNRDAAKSRQTAKESSALIIQADFSGLVMAGVAYSVSRELDIFNLRPVIPLYDIAAASASLAFNAHTWPAGTVFISVVDPDVGTGERKPVVLKTETGLFFVSPDNGSLSGPAKRYGIAAVREIDESVNRIPGSEWSHTSHGRDVYSYTGARLAAGVISFEQVGPLQEPRVVMLPVLPAKLEGGVLYGHVTGGTGRMGNISLSIDRELLAQVDASHGDVFDVSIKNGGEVVWRGNAPYVRSFGSVAVGENLLFMNSSEELSIAVNLGNFAKENNIGHGEDWTVEISRSEKGAGYN